MRPPRLVLAAAAALAAFAATHVAMRLLLHAYACRTPAAWWPDWAWRCLDPGIRAVQSLTRLGWDTALPLFAAVAVFLAIGLTRKA
ncbi:hypothetical protein [Jannaschia formosa]|uniref:hypothetical protein n=1 Tax=Jannaschia formosa TaxID=2259592 RepID=UPI000E1BC8D6|nr:hypothetical protein [Jannaschia formosa]TFL19917.1 hypothetical protein DR046_00795 [Jannaschia formosa]